MADKPRIHGRDHRPGGADPTGPWDSTATAGTSYGVRSLDATAGQVLTADGANGSVWEDAAAAATSLPNARLRTSAAHANTGSTQTRFGVTFRLRWFDLSVGTPIVHDDLGISTVVFGGVFGNPSGVQVPTGVYLVAASVEYELPAQTVDRRLALELGSGTAPTIYGWGGSGQREIPVDDGTAHDGIAGEMETVSQWFFYNSSLTYPGGGPATFLPTALENDVTELSTGRTLSMTIVRLASVGDGD